MTEDFKLISPEDAYQIGILNGMGKVRICGFSSFIIKDRGQRQLVCCIRKARHNGEHWILHKDLPYEAYARGVQLGSGGRRD